jgi:flavin reductase (DIM6/NTAB) family NADH-FMN oxidoreductase RutF
MLEIEHFYIRGDILRRQPSVPRQTVIYTHDNPDVRKISAKIEADLVQPVCSLGNGKYGKLEDDGIYHMCRPRLLCSHNCTDTSSTVVTTATNQTGGIWIVDTLRKVEPVNTKSTSTMSSTGSSLADVEYNYRNEPYCKLGYNPTKQIVAPRPIGWLSTYAAKRHAEETEEEKGKSNSDIQKIAHIAPYSFFIDVGRGDETSMVAFIACLREDDEDDASFQLLRSQHDSNHYNNNNNNKKDAHRDSEETGVFAWNMVSKDLAVEMNYSAAEVNRIESEFEMAKLSHLPARTIDAPIVPSSPVIFECTYVTTLLVPRSKPSIERQWYCIIGHVGAIQIRKDVLVPTKNLLSLSPMKEENTDAMILDIEKIKPVARLGYEQEYGVIVPFLTNSGERYNV